MEISLVERALTPVDRRTFTRLRASPRVGRLIETGIIALNSSRGVPYGVRAGPYVGRCSLEDGTQIEVREKASGAVTALLEWCLSKDTRIICGAGPAFRNQHAPWILASRFVTSVGRYLSSGQLKEYVAPLEVRTKSSGRLNLPGILRLRARGRSGVIACHPPQLSSDVLVNHLAYTALRVCEQLLGNSAESDGLGPTIRAYLRILHSSSFREGALRREVSISQACETCFKRYVGNGTASEMIALARAVLLDLGFFGDTTVGDISESCFISLENLFERAVCEILRETGFGMRGKTLGNPVFTDRPDAEPVDPDFVIVARSGKTLLVGDCKFKEPGSNPSADDVYQLLTHARACVCHSAALVYPGSERRFSLFGRTVDGTAMYVCTVRLGCLDEDVRALVGDCERMDRTVGQRS